MLIKITLVLRLAPATIARNLGTSPQTAQSPKALCEVPPTEIDTQDIIVKAVTAALEAWDNKGTGATEEVKEDFRSVDGKRHPVQPIYSQFWRNVW